MDIAGTRWGLWALLIDGKLNKEEIMEENKELSVAELEGTCRRTTSAKR